MDGEVPQDGFEAMDRLFDLTGVPVPKNLSELRGKRARFSDCIGREEMLPYVQRAVQP